DPGAQQGPRHADAGNRHRPRHGRGAPALCTQRLYAARPLSRLSGQRMVGFLRDADRNLDCRLTYEGFALTDLTKLSLAEARKGLKAKSFTATELTGAYLGAIEKANPSLNAFVAVTPEKALDMAKASDEKLAQGQGGTLEGIPLGIKDLFATKGVHTQAASHSLDGFKPEYESTVTANLWRDGAVMLGKLNMDEFAMGSSNETSYYGPVVSPFRAEGSNAKLVPGGSSGGSAAAVSAWLCAGATATDTGGSIRQPAAFTGTVGVKPTYGRCSRWGTVAFASSLDQAGPI